MSDKKTKSRNEISEEFKWDLSLMYSDEKIWEDDLATARSLAQGFTKYAGKLQDANVLATAFEEKDKAWRMLEKAYVYARMKKDEDNTDAKYQSMSERAQSIASQMSADMAFFTPELMAVPTEELLNAVSNEERLKVYAHAIKDMIREKSHILTEAEERLMAQFSEITSAPNSIFTMINNADIKFGNVKDEDGEEVELTHGKYIGFLESSNRDVRRDAFKTMYGAFIKQKNTIAATYNYSVKTDVTNAKIRKYDSALDAALSSDNIKDDVYTNLIDTVHSGLDTMHGYVELRRKALGLDEVRMYDMYTPLVKVPNKKIEYKDGVEMIKRALTPLGQEYIDIMSKGFEARWIDVYETPNKRSGAYSFGCHDSAPYILLNYHGKLKDVSTVAHEMGHSMHSYFSRKEQPYVYSGHSIFTAEVASTVNESLLIEHMIENCTDKTEKAYLLNLFIEDFRGTFFRQTMFAEFEKITHAAVEAGEVLTHQWLSNAYGELNRKYFGDKIVYDDEISMEWARIPHFYNAFYVYKYATGYSAAIALSEKLLKGGDKERVDYINFLKAGENDYPVELLKGAGVDMSKPEPVKNALKKFQALVGEMEKLV